MNLSFVYTEKHRVPVALNFEEVMLVNKLERNLGYLEGMFISGEAESEDILKMDNQQRREFKSVMLTTVSVLGDEMSILRAKEVLTELDKLGQGTYPLRLKNYPDVVYQISIQQKDDKVLVSTKRQAN